MAINEHHTILFIPGEDKYKYGEVIEEMKSLESGVSGSYWAANHL